MKKLLTLLTGFTIISTLLLANFDSVSAYASEADGDADRPLCLPNFQKALALIALRLDQSLSCRNSPPWGSLILKRRFTPH